MLWKEEGGLLCRQGTLPPAAARSCRACRRRQMAHASTFQRLLQAASRYQLAGVRLQLAASRTRAAQHSLPCLGRAPRPEQPARSPEHLVESAAVFNKRLGTAAAPAPLLHCTRRPLDPCTFGPRLPNRGEAETHHTLFSSHNPRLV